MADESPKLIVHADDFGISEDINEGILKAHLSGILTSTSIIASGMAFEQAIEICHATPTLDIGVHLTLVEEQALLAPQQVPSLAGHDGTLPGNARDFVKKYFTGRISLSEVKAELEAQISKVVSCGVTVSHLDGHQHLHMLPAIYKITKDLAKKYNIPAIRIPNENLSAYMFQKTGMAGRLIELLVLKMFCVLVDRRDTITTDFYCGFFFGGNLAKGNLMTVLKNLPATGSCEIMCHPGLERNDAGQYDWGYHWMDELNALTDQEIAEYIQGKEIRLVSYRDIVNS